VLAGVTGSLATVGLLAAIGALDRDDGSGAVAAGTGVTSAVSTNGNATQLAADTADSLVVVRVASTGGTRTGTGVCVGQSGSVLTSAVLVDDAETVVVIASDGRESTATVRGRDPVSDLVLLDLEADLSIASIAIETPTPGDDVYAVGAPTAGHSAPWVSHGVVASLDATTTRANGTSLTGLIETDAAASEGAAGGVLLDHDGDVVGIVVWPASGRAGALAVPIDVALEVAHELSRTGWVERAWIGINGVDRDDGVEVTKVIADGPAARAGVRIGDVVTALGERDVTQMAELLTVVRRHDPGEELTITVRRDDDMQTLAVTLGTKRPGSGSTDPQPALATP